MMSKYLKQNVVLIFFFFLIVMLYFIDIFFNRYSSINSVNSCLQTLLCYLVLNQYFISKIWPLVRSRTSNCYKIIPRFPPTFKSLVCSIQCPF